jgi:WD40 repeat protein
VAFSPDGKLIAILATLLGHWYYPTTTLYICDAKSGVELRSVHIHDHAYFLTFSPDGKNIATGGGEQVFVWEASTLKLRLRFPHADKPWDRSCGPPSFSPDGKLLAVAYPDSTVSLWDITGLPSAQTGQAGGK